MKRYIIVQATSVRKTGGGRCSGPPGTIQPDRPCYSCSVQVPTFFLDAQMLGILSAVDGRIDREQAEQIARRVIDPHGVHEVHVSVEWCED